MEKNKIIVSDTIFGKNFFNKKYSEQCNAIYVKLGLKNFNEITDGEKKIINAFLGFHHKKKTFLDPIYIQCLTESSKYNYFIKPYIKKNYNNYCKNILNYIDNSNNKRKVLNYSKKVVDIAFINNKYEKLIFSNSAKQIISGNKLNVVDTKILSRYYALESIKGLEKEIYIEPYDHSIKPYFKKGYFTNFKYNFNVLKERLITNYNIYGFYDQVDTININYRRLHLERILRGKKVSLYNTLTTVFHECEHIKQCEKMKNPSSYDLDTLNMVKEFVVTEEQKYYDNNYENLTFEIKADLAGNIKAKRVLKSNNPRIYYKLKPMIDLEIKTYKEKLKKYKSHFYGDEYYESSDAIEKAFLKVFDKYTAKEFIADYPILRLQYNEDGSYKNLLELKEVRANLLKNNYNEKEVNRLYDNLRWNYIKYKININNFYEDSNKRISNNRKKLY